MTPRIRARLTKTPVLFCAAAGEYASDGSHATKPTLTVRLKLWAQSIHNVTSTPSSSTVYLFHFPEFHLFAVNVAEEISTWFLPFSAFLLSLCPCRPFYLLPSPIYYIFSPLVSSNSSFCVFFF
jgi:hypothetical protein